MKSKLSKFAQAAAFGLAITFTLSCSGGDDDKDGGGTSSPGGSLSSSGGNGSGDGSSGSATGGGGGSSSSLSGGGSSSSATGGGGLTGTSGTFVDIRDSKSYKWVKIGDQYWFAENLNYDVPNNDTDVCYDNNPDYCVTYGRLYNWATAMGIDAAYNEERYGNGSDDPNSNVNFQGICPAGWHLSRPAEWNSLRDIAGGSSIDAKKLMAESGWFSIRDDSEIKGADDYGFAALPGGSFGTTGQFVNVGSFGYWWSSYETNSKMALDFQIYNDIDNNGKLTTSGTSKKNLFSVRCVKDQ